MTEKDKDILLQDLCARLPYRVKFKWCDNFHTDDYFTLIGINEGQITGRDVNQDDCLFFWGEDKIKPYLRPMSSMTDEELKEYSSLWNLQDEYSTDLDIQYKIDLFEWLNKNMFDYRGLIPKDLAIVVTEDNNPYKE